MAHCSRIVPGKMMIEILRVKTTINNFMSACKNSALSFSTSPLTEFMQPASVKYSRNPDFTLTPQRLSIHLMPTAGLSFHPALYWATLSTGCYTVLSFKNEILHIYAAVLHVFEIQHKVMWVEMDKWLKRRHKTWSMHSTLITFLHWSLGLASCVLLFWLFNTLVSSLSIFQSRNIWIE